MLELLLNGRLLLLLDELATTELELLNAELMLDALLLAELKLLELRLLETRLLELKLAELKLLELRLLEIKLLELELSALELTRLELLRLELGLLLALRLVALRLLTLALLLDIRLLDRADALLVATLDDALLDTAELLMAELLTAELLIAELVERLVALLLALADAGLLLDTAELRLPPPKDEATTAEEAALEATLAELLSDALVDKTLLLARLNTLLLETDATDRLRLELLDSGATALLFILWLLFTLGLLPLKLASPPPPPQAQRPATKLLASNMRAIGIVISIMLESCQDIINR